MNENKDKDAQETASTDKFQHMTQDPVPGLVIRLSIPTIISMLITSFYNMADTFFVGRIGTSATAAVGVVFPVMAVIQALGFFCGHGSGNSISRRLGARESKTAGELAATGFFASLFLGILVTVWGLAFLTPLAKILGSTETILPYTKDYLRIILVGAPFMCAQFVLNNQIRFQGSAMFSMIGITVGAVLNIVLDPLLIFGLNMGIAGAAAATVISQFVSFLLLFVILHVSGCIPIRVRNVRLNKERLAEIVGGGLPSLFRQGLGSVGTLVLNLAARPYGDAAIAAMSIVGRVSMFAMSSLIGFGQGFQPVCGFNYGAKKYDRVKEAFWFCVKISTVVLTFLAVCGFAFSNQLIGLFRDDPEVVRIGAFALRLLCVPFVLSGWTVMNNMMTQTMGKTLYASILASARQGLCLIPLLLVLPRVFGLAGIQMAQPISDLLAAGIATVLYFAVMRELKEEEHSTTPYSGSSTDIS